MDVGRVPLETATSDQRTRRSFYGGGEDYRIVPIDGRTHNPVRARDVTFFGHAVSHWDGETLVVDSIGFNDLTWLARGGYFHSDKLRVVERLRREGNVLHYQTMTTTVRTW